MRKECIDKGNGKVILLVHGLFGALSNWKTVINELSKNYRVIVPKLPITKVDPSKASITGLSEFMSSFISSAQFDLDDGHKFAFIQKVYPDVTFDGSTVDSPSATLSLFAAQNSGSGRNSPASEGGTNTGSITRTATAPIEAFTSRLDLRVRGRQLALKIESSNAGVKWQLGSPRLELRPDGRR